MLTEGNKYSMEHRATTHTLAIRKLDVADSGEYACDTGDKRTSATVTVKGNKHLLVPPITKLWVDSSTGKQKMKGVDFYVAVITRIALCSPCDVVRSIA